jgi:hypothetical protein
LHSQSDLPGVVVITDRGQTPGVARIDLHINLAEP